MQHALADSPTRIFGVIVEEKKVTNDFISINQLLYMWSLFDIRKYLFVLLPKQENKVEKERLD